MNATARPLPVMPAAETDRPTARAGAIGAPNDYDPASTLREALARYFEDNGFGADGGYNARWLKLKLGPIPYVIPNTAGRVRAVRYHDLHHIATGYLTNWMGEFEIGAWEVGSGCRDFVAAWFLNLSAMASGMFLSPRRMLRAFVRGRRSRNLYGRTYDDALLDTRVGEMRAELGLDRAVEPATAGDLVRFVAFLLAGLPIAAFMVVPGLVPLAYFVAWGAGKLAGRA